MLVSRLSNDQIHRLFSIFYRIKGMDLSKSVGVKEWLREVTGCLPPFPLRLFFPGSQVHVQYAVYQLLLFLCACFNCVLA